MRMSGRPRLVNERNETSPRAHEFSVGLAHDGKQSPFLDGNAVAIDAKGCESEQGGTGPAAQCQPYPSVHKDPSAIGRMAEQRVRPCSNNCLVRPGAYVAREGGAQKPPAVSAEDGDSANGDDATHEHSEGERGKQAYGRQPRDREGND